MAAPTSGSDDSSEASDDDHREDGVISTLFHRDPKTNLYKITRNRSARDVNIISELPIGGYPVGYEGFCSFLDMRKWPEEDRSVLHLEDSIGYSSTKKSGHGPSDTVMCNVGGVEYEMVKVTRVCSGVKVCSTLPGERRVARHFGLECELSEMDITAFSPPQFSPAETQERVNRDAFFWAESQWRPCPCILAGSSPLDLSSGSFQSVPAVAPNQKGGWVAKQGRTSRQTGDILSNFVGCKNYTFVEPEERRGENKHRMMGIPAEFADANVTVLNDWCTRAENGEEMPPPMEHASDGLCHAVREKSYKGKFCLYPGHGRHRARMEAVVCNAANNVRWVILVPIRNPTFGLVLGYGRHHHPRPSMTLPTRIVHVELERILTQDPEATTMTAMARILASRNLARNRSTLTKLIGKWRASRHPLGRSIQTLKFFEESKVRKLEQGEELTPAEEYIQEIKIGVDSGDGKDDIISVILGKNDLLDLAAKDGRFAIDGTFNAAEPGSAGMGSNIELLSIVGKCRKTGR